MTTPTLDDPAARPAIAAADPAIAAFIERAGPYAPRPGDGDPFASLARAILFQQLATGAATAIHRRFVEAIGGTVTADAILATAPEVLRAAGLSTAKTTSLLDLATKVTDGSVPLEGIEVLSDDEIVARLTTVRGIGRWTAEMFLIFYMMRPDVLPLDDIGLQNAVSRLYYKGKPRTRQQLIRFAKRWEPWRSVATWYMWRSLDPVPVEY